MPSDKVTGGDTITAAKENDITVGTTAPSSPTNGWVWVDTNAGVYLIKVWEGGAWVLKAAGFDATVPVTQAFGDSAAAGSVNASAHRDHKHGMPADPHVEAKETAGSGSTESVTWAVAYGGTPVVAASLVTNINYCVTVTARSSSGATLFSWDSVTGGGVNVVKMAVARMAT